MGHKSGFLSEEKLRKLQGPRNPIVKLPRLMSVAEKTIALFKYSQWIEKFLKCDDGISVFSSVGAAYL